MKPPGLEPRRFSDFERELLDRARTWIPSWGLADGERDFGRALLEVAARFNSEVAERLDQVGDKVAAGFSTGSRWVARRQGPRECRWRFSLQTRRARPSMRRIRCECKSMPSARNVSFETETDIRIVPGRLQLVVGVDPDKDKLFLPPPGLS